MMDARKFLINLLYRATAQSSEVPGWSHRQTKKPDQGRVVVAPARCLFQRHLNPPRLGVAAIGGRHGGLAQV
ncbi:MAG: hypothetical protein KA131_08270, partial [Thauera sp.]|nr:hypothetical protein [Thauera sp.]